MFFLKEDMEGTHYNWSTDPAKPAFAGEPTRRLFDPNNGDQVLFLINCFANGTEHFTKSMGKLIEEKMNNQLPFDAKSEITVFNWIIERFSEKPGALTIPVDNLATKN